MAFYFISTMYTYPTKSGLQHGRVLGFEWKLGAQGISRMHRVWARYIVM